MRNIICSLAMILSVNALCEEGKAPLALASVEQNAHEGSNNNEEITKLFKTMESNMFPSSAFAEMTLTSYKGDKKLKELKMEFVSKQDSVLIEIKAPAVDRGKYILKSSDNLWMYFSEIKRSIRIASRDSFMGTDANNYDLLELDLVGDYELTSHKEEIIEGIKLIRAELTAKPDTEGYASIVSYLDPEKKIIVKNDCYALSGVLLKSIHYFDHKQVGDYFVPSKITFVSQLEASRHSVVSLNGVKPQYDLADSLFSLGYLESLN